MTLSDSNAQVGNTPIDIVKERFNEDTLKNNGDRLIEMKQKIHSPRIKPI